MNKLMMLKNAARKHTYKLTKVDHEGFTFETENVIDILGFAEPQKITLHCILDLTSWGTTIYPETFYEYAKLESAVEYINYGADTHVNPSECVLTVDELVVITQHVITTAFATLSPDTLEIEHDYRIEQDTFEDGRPKINLYVDGAVYAVMNGTAFTAVYDNITTALTEAGLFFEPETPFVITICETVF